MRRGQYYHNCKKAIRTLTDGNDRNLKYTVCLKCKIFVDLDDSYVLLKSSQKSASTRVLFCEKTNDTIALANDDKLNYDHDTSTL